jgi:hypothetical protein
MQRFALTAEDALWHPKLNEQYFKERAQEKLQKISDYHGLEGKLIYLNLTSWHARPLIYYDNKFSEVTTLTQAQIIVVQGCLDKHQANNYQVAFQQFLIDLKNNLSQPQPEV